MIKFFLLLYAGIVLPLFAVEGLTYESEPDTVNVFLILEQLHKNEAILGTLKATVDANATQSDPFYDKKLSQYAEQKVAILLRAIDGVRAGMVKGAFDTQQYNEQKIFLGYKIGVNAKLGYTMAVKRDEAALLVMEVKNRINHFFIELETALQEGLASEALDEMILQEMAWLQSLPVDEYMAEAMQSDASAVMAEFKSSAGELEKLTYGYKEMLTFFQQKRRLLLSDSRVKMKAWLDRLDALVPYRIGDIGFGKAVLMSIILLFFLSIRRLIAKLTVFILHRSLMKQSNVLVHAYFVKAIQLPISIFFIVYAIGLVLEVYYYPMLLEPGVAQWLNIVFFVILSWTVLKLVSVYGEYTLSSLVKTNERLRKEVVNISIKLGYFLIFVVILFIIFRKLDYNVSAIIASLGIGGLAVALAAKDTLANFFASVMILMDNSFSQGDWIECDGIEGIVVEIGLRRTTIRTFDNAMLFVPNSRLAENSIRNWSRRKVGRRIKMHVGVMYDSPPQKIKGCVADIRQMLMNHDGITKPDEMASATDTCLLPDYHSEFVSQDDLKGYKRTFLVYLDQLNSSSIDILVYCFTRTTDWEEWLAIKEEVVYNVINIVHAHGLSFAFPSQSLYVERLPGHGRDD